MTRQQLMVANVSKLTLGLLLRCVLAFSLALKCSGKRNDLNIYSTIPWQLGRLCEAWTFNSQMKKRKMSKKGSKIRLNMWTLSFKWSDCVYSYSHIVRAEWCMLTDFHQLQQVRTQEGRLNSWVGTLLETSVLCEPSVDIDISFNHTCI